MGSMYHHIDDRVIVFDVEYVPCVDTIRKVYKLPESMPNNDVLDVLYNANGRSEEDPHPMVKFMYYKVIAISGLVRRVKDYNAENLEDRISIEHFSLPRDVIEWSEKEIIEKFFNYVGSAQFQIVGWAINQFDLNVLFQRAFINKCVISTFCTRPSKPWEGVDYFTKFSKHVVDLIEVICGSGSKSRCSLDEIASASNIPGKIGIEGKDVCGIYYNGDEDSHRSIIDYCDTDTFTTYLVWLNTALMAGFLSKDQYLAERNIIHDMVMENTKDSEHWSKFLEAWKLEIEVF